MTTTRPVDPPPTEDPTVRPLTEQEALEAAGVVARAATALRHRLVATPATDAAWAHYAETVEAAVFRLQLELVLAGARLTAERAHDHDDVHDALTTASEHGRQVVDTLRVRAHLGRLEAQSAAEEALGELDHLAADVRDASRRVQHSATTSLDELRHGATVAIRDVVAVLRAAAATAHADDVPPPDGVST